MNLKDYNIVWTSQSRNASESMPCGGYDTGVSAWVEDGALLFYIDRSGSFDENNQMLKLGRIRASVSPNPLAVPESTFSQTLDLETGRIVVVAAAPGYPSVRYVLWCETGAPAVHLEVDADAPVCVNARYETWRHSDQDVPPDRRMPLYSMLGYPGRVTTYADHIAYNGDGVLFCHQNRNENNCFEKVAALEGLGGQIDGMFNPQKDFIFGGYMAGDGFSPDGVTEGVYAQVPYAGYGIAASDRRRAHVTICLHSEQNPDIVAYRDTLLERAAQCAAGIDAGRDAALDYWRKFWARSYIAIENGAGDRSSTAWQTGRNYNLFRFMLGFNEKGAYPTKFNGGLLTSDAMYSVDAQRYAGVTPDYRNWGGGSFTAQNQRLMYWPMLKSGDFDLMPPQFAFYSQSLPNAEARVRQYWGHEGCAFTEQMENFGLPVGAEWGWPNANHSPEIYARRPAHDPTEITGPWIRYLYSTQLEFCYMILQYGRYTGRDIAEYRRLIHSCIVFFDRHYRMRHSMNLVRELDLDGKLVFYPSTALETYKDATNPTELIAALRAVLQEILGHHGDCFAGHVAEYEKILDTLPPISLREVEGKRVIAPAKSWSDIMNIELPQLYPVFPYGLYGLMRPDLELAIDTYYAPEDVPGQKDHISWHQSNIFAARLGLTDEARKYTFAKLADGPRRFPAYWGPGHDWVPDHNWGGSGMIGLQEMLLQEVDGTLLLFPAWPRALDVRFKLHASGNTVVEAAVENGKARVIGISPEARRADIRICGEA